MRYLVLASDYDGTLAHHGSVTAETIDAVNELKRTGRKAILVTGRELPDLQKVFVDYGIFDCIVAENGAIVYYPATNELRVLAAKPPAEFVNALNQRGIVPSVGNVIVATWHPNETVVMEVIRDLGLELQVIFNKGAVMVLPSGVNKAFGLTAALKEMHLSPHNVAAIGDAENDHAFLEICECSVAVKNSVEALKAKADMVTIGDHGEGVRELVRQIIDNDLATLENRLERHNLQIGRTENDEPVLVNAHGSCVLIAGTSGSGKSTLATAFMESLMDHQYQFCIIDPEGDYDEFEPVVALGNAKQPPTPQEIGGLIENPEQNLSLNLIGVGIEERPAFFEGIFLNVLQIRNKLGHPHWMVLDETHHVLPDTWSPAERLLPREIEGMLMITVHPNHVSKNVLESVNVFIAIGLKVDETIGIFAAKLGKDVPETNFGDLQPGEAVFWKPDEPPFLFHVNKPKAKRKRHIRKYAEGELGPDKSFYFRGADRKLNLRAENLNTFIKLAEGIDDETWVHHLKHGEYSEWIRESIKDDELASEIQNVENNASLNPSESREQIKKAIEAKYTAPA